MTKSTINEDTDAVTIKNKEWWFVLRSEGWFGGRGYLQFGRGEFF
jgi:hypothetical protein